MWEETEKKKKEEKEKEEEGEEEEKDPAGRMTSSMWQPVWRVVAAMGAMVRR